MCKAAGVTLSVQASYVESQVVSDSFLDLGAEVCASPAVPEAGLRHTAALCFLNVWVGVGLQAKTFLRTFMFCV